MSERSLRPVFKYVPQLCALADIRKGDVYRIGKFDETDEVDDNQLWLAESDAKPDKERGFGSVVQGHTLKIDNSIETPCFPIEYDDA